MNLNNSSFVIVSHATLDSKGNSIYGTGSVIEDFLVKKKNNYVYILHPISIEKFILVKKNINEKRTTVRIPTKEHRLLLFKSLGELIVTFNIVNGLRSKQDFFIGIDPLSALFGILLKKLNKCKKVIFYTADYADKRFNNFLLNYIYHLVDKFVSSQADQVWNVSTRITALRGKQGVKANRNFFVPNSPIFSSIKRLSLTEIDKNTLIIVSTLLKSVDFLLIFKTIKRLSHKYKNIKLQIVGPETLIKELNPAIERLGIKGRVNFLGILSHEKLLSYLTKAGIGIALYTNNYPWTYYCDSMKIRDYLACGLPVITTRATSTAEDVENNEAGCVIDLNEKELLEAIESILEDDDKYKLMRRNAIKLARKYDMEKILEKVLKEVL